MDPVAQNSSALKVTTPRMNLAKSEQDLVIWIDCALTILRGYIHFSQNRQLLINSYIEKLNKEDSDFKASLPGRIDILCAANQNSQDCNRGLLEQKLMLEYLKTANESDYFIFQNYPLWLRKYLHCKDYFTAVPFTHENLITEANKILNMTDLEFLTFDLESQDARQKGSPSGAFVDNAHNYLTTLSISDNMEILTLKLIRDMLTAIIDVRSNFVRYQKLAQSTTNPRSPRFDSPTEIIARAKTIGTSTLTTNHNSTTSPPTSPSKAVRRVTEKAAQSKADTSERKISPIPPGITVQPLIFDFGKKYPPSVDYTDQDLKSFEQTVAIPCKNMGLALVPLNIHLSKWNQTLIDKIHELFRTLYLSEAPEEVASTSEGSGIRRDYKSYINQTFQHINEAILDPLEFDRKKRDIYEFLEQIDNTFNTVQQYPEKKLLTTAETPLREYLDSIGSNPLRLIGIRDMKMEEVKNKFLNFGNNLSLHIDDIKQNIIELSDLKEFLNSIDSSPNELDTILSHLKQTCTTSSQKIVQIDLFLEKWVKFCKALTEPLKQLHRNYELQKTLNVLWNGITNLPD